MCSAGELRLVEWNEEENGTHAEFKYGEDLYVNFCI